MEQTVITNSPGLRASGELPERFTRLPKEEQDRFCNWLNYEQMPILSTSGDRSSSLCSDRLGFVGKLIHPEAAEAEKMHIDPRSLLSILCTAVTIEDEKRACKQLEIEHQTLANLVGQYTYIGDWPAKEEGPLASLPSEQEAREKRFLGQLAHLQRSEIPLRIHEQLVKITNLLFPK